MGAYFYTPGTAKIKDDLHDYFSIKSIKKNAAVWSPLFDPSNRASKISDALDAMNFPLPDKTFGDQLRARFKLLFDRMQAADAKWGTTTHDDIKQAVFDALQDKKVRPVRFYVSHQADEEPFSAKKPEYRFVSWLDKDDRGKLAYNFLLVCPELPGQIARRLRKAIGRTSPAARKSAAVKKAKKKTTKKATRR